MILVIFTLILAHTGINIPQAAQIYQYEAPIVTIRAGNAWIIEGNFKLVHVVNLDEYSRIADNITTLAKKFIPPGKTKEIIDYHLSQVQDRLTSLSSVQHRNRRSIDWIGSAWKWVAGSPDAADWNTILKSQNDIIHNNNEQYKINAQLLKTTDDIIQKTNKLIDRMNEISNGKEAERVGQDTVNEVLILKDTINEIVRACQLAKSGIINTNLLDKTEVENIVTEMATLPYSNAVEAIEYGNPSIYTNGSLLLYILSIPKLKTDSYHRIFTRATIRRGKQIELPYNEILISQNETYGVKSQCLTINRATVCRKSSLIQLAEETCIPRILKGGNASCQYRMTQRQIVEMITADTIFLTNFVGLVRGPGRKESLNGTYLVQLFNETLLIGNETFSSTSTVKVQPLPPVLTSVMDERLLVDIEQVHNVSLANINNLQYLGTKMNLSLVSYAGIMVTLGICLGVLWYKMTRSLNLPTVKPPQLTEVITQPTNGICGTQIFEGGRVNHTADAAEH